MIEVNYNEYKETIAENIKLIVENHKLKEKYYLMRTNANQLAKRIDKAIKDLEKYETISGYYDGNYDGENDTYSHDNVKDDLLKILSGGEEKE